MEEKVCGHSWKNVRLNNTGDYIVFPLMCYHRGYYNESVKKVFITAQVVFDSIWKYWNTTSIMLILLCRWWLWSRPARSIDYQGIDLWCAVELGYQLPSLGVSPMQKFWWWCWSSFQLADSKETVQSGTTYQEAGGHIQGEVPLCFCWHGVDSTKRERRGWVSGMAMRLSFKPKNFQNNCSEPFEFGIRAWGCVI